MEQNSVLEKVTKFILNKILDDSLICKAIHNKVPMFGTTNITNRAKLLDTNIMDYKFITEDVDKQDIFISMDQAVVAEDSEVFDDVAIAIYIWVHKDLVSALDPDNAGNRINRILYLTKRIRKQIDGSDGLGVGKLKFQRAQGDLLNPAFPGMMLMYKLVEYSDSHAEQLERKS